MKKIILVAAAFAFTTTAWAQKQNIQTASNYLNDKDYDKAVEYINMAVNDPSTKDNPKAWYVKSRIYMAMQQDASKKANNPYREAATSLMKVVQLDTKYEKEDVNTALTICAYNFYNDAVANYNKKMYDEAYTLAKGTVDIHDLEGGKRFAGNKSFDTVAAQAMVMEAFSAYYAKKYDEAQPVLEALKNNPIGKSANVYLTLSDIYNRQGKPDQQIAMLEEGRAQFLDNANLRNEELNYYIRTGKQDVLMKKLEEAAAKEPNNAELQFNLANGYANMAIPKDANGKELPKPDNYTDLLAKAEAAYAKAIAIDGNNGGYNYNAGVLYYNEGTELNKQMNKEADLSNSAKVAAEKKKHEDAYNKLTAQRDVLFDKAVPYFEKTVSTLGANVGSLNADDKFSYQSSLIALKEIYARKNQLDKSEEMKKKIEALRSK